MINKGGSTYITSDIWVPASVSMVAVGLAVAAMAVFALVGLAKFVIHILP